MDYMERPKKPSLVYAIFAFYIFSFWQFINTLRVINVEFEIPMALGIVFIIFFFRMNPFAVTIGIVFFFFIAAFQIFMLFFQIFYLKQQIIYFGLIISFISITVSIFSGVYLLSPKIRQLSIDMEKYYLEKKQLKKMSKDLK